MRRKRLFCFLLAAVLLLGLTPGASAEPGVYFTMINSNRPETLATHTMPFNRNGTIYVPVSTLARVGIVDVETSSGIRLSLSNHPNVYVYFDLAEGTNVTHRGDSLSDGTGYVSPLLRFGTYFFPVGRTSTGPLMTHFSIQYRLISSDPAPIVRLYNEAIGALFSHDTLLYNADIFYDLTARLESHLGVQQEGGETGSASVVSTPPPPSNGNGNHGDENNVDPEDPAAEGSPESENGADVAPPVSVSLGFVGLTDETEGLLDALYAANISAGFFVTAQEINANSDMVRRLHGEGHQLGVYLSEDVEAEFSAASEALFAAARLRTVLVAANDETVAQEASDLGLLVHGADIVREFTGVGTLEELSGDLLLDSETANPYALRALTATLRSGAYRVSRVIHAIFESLAS